MAGREIKRECPLRPSHIENIWHMMKNQNFSYSSQRYPRESLETWCDFFLEMFLNRQENQKSVTDPRLVKNTQISVTNTLSKTSLCLIRIKITRQFEPGNLFLRSLQVFRGQLYLWVNFQGHDEPLKITKIRLLKILNYAHIFNRQIRYPVKHQNT